MAHHPYARLHSCEPPRHFMIDHSSQEVTTKDARQMEIAFRHIANAIMKQSKLDISLIRISNVTDDTFHVSLEARASNTGPVSATISPMTLKLCGPKGSFGVMTLPELVTGLGGTPITIDNQLVEITDTEALQAFIQPIIKTRGATLSLKTGCASIHVPAFGILPRLIYYERDVPLAGMCGLEVTIITATITPPSHRRPLSPRRSSSCASNASSSRMGITVIVRVKNPSPVELSFGVCDFELRNEEGEVFAELKGGLDMRTQYFDITLLGTADKRVAVGGQARLVGKSCASGGWCSQTIRGIDVPIADMWKLLQVLDMQHGKPEPKIPSVSRWRGKFWKNCA
ncbi:hypothetical protein F4677DRAFT_460618 [Hypoxylon crocopeplum]|nr:hypothetical protein F4677DRAFT_460618 [Hypoxylon crocopeplum]